MWERVLLAKLRMELEATDVVLKRLLQDCAASSGHTTYPPLLSAMVGFGSRFWSEFSGVPPLLIRWTRWLASHHPTSSTSTEDELTSRIWRSFLCRLSLETNLLKSPRGNDVLRLLVEVTEDVVYSSFFPSLPDRVDPLDSPRSIVSHSSRASSSPSSSYLSLHEDRPPPMNSLDLFGNRSRPSMTTLPRIPELPEHHPDPYDNHPTGFETATEPEGERRGTPIRLKKTPVPTTSHRTRHRRSKDAKDRRRDDSPSDSEDGE